MVIMIMTLHSLPLTLSPENMVCKWFASHCNGGHASFLGLLFVAALLLQSLLLFLSHDLCIVHFLLESITLREFLLGALGSAVGGAFSVLLSLVASGHFCSIVSLEEERLSLALAETRRCSRKLETHLIGLLNLLTAQRNADYKLTLN